MQSKWQESNLTIDGSKQDWDNNLKYLKDEKVAVGITNDDENLYLCLVISENQKIMNLLRSGFTIWFEPQSSDTEKFGVQYPIKNNNMVVQDFSKRSKTIDQRDMQEKIINKILIEQNELLVLNEDKYPLYASPLKGDNGIEVKIGYEFKQLVYELKIPLANGKDGLLNINTESKEEIRLGFVSEKMERPERSGMQQQMGNKGSGGGMSGGGGGRRGGGKSGGQIPQRARATMEPIDFWIETVIASN